MMSFKDEENAGHLDGLAQRAPWHERARAAVGLGIRDMFGELRELLVELTLELADLLLPVEQYDAAREEYLERRSTPISRRPQSGSQPAASPPRAAPQGR